MKLFTKSITLATLAISIVSIFSSAAFASGATSGVQLNLKDILQQDMETYKSEQISKYNAATESEKRIMTATAKEYCNAEKPENWAGIDYGNWLKLSGTFCSLQKSFEDISIFSKSSALQSKSNYKSKLVVGKDHSGKRAIYKCEYLEGVNSNKCLNAIKVVDADYMFKNPNLPIVYVAASLDPFSTRDCGWTRAYDLNGNLLGIISKNSNYYEMNGNKLIGAEKFVKLADDGITVKGEYEIFNSLKQNPMTIGDPSAALEGRRGQLVIDNTYGTYNHKTGEIVAGIRLTWAYAIVDKKSGTIHYKSMGNFDRDYPELMKATEARVDKIPHWFD